MISSIDPSSERFLADLSRIQNEINTAERQTSSGLKISQPSDAPEQLSSLLRIQADLDHCKDTQPGNINEMLCAVAADKAVDAV